MAAILNVKKGDTSTWPTMTLKAQGNPVDLTNAGEVRFRATKIASYDLLTDTFQALTAVGSPRIDAPMDIKVRADGTVEYTPDASEVSEAGKYRWEIEVTWNDEKISTFPSEGFGALFIREDLD